MAKSKEQKNGLKLVQTGTGQPGPAPKHASDHRRSDAVETIRVSTDADPKRLAQLEARLEAIDQDAMEHQLETLDAVTFFGERLEEVEQRLKKTRAQAKKQAKTIEDQHEVIDQQQAYIDLLEAELKKHSEYLSRLWRFRKQRKELQSFAQRGLEGH